jgi:hypothetical protein
MQEESGEERVRPLLKVHSIHLVCDGEIRVNRGTEI